ncbi:15137_t:CDS:2, partial [Funneliformis geosporum]
YFKNETYGPRTQLRFSKYKWRIGLKQRNGKLIKKTSLGIWHPIPVTCEEADILKTESSLTKSQILSIVNSLTPFLDDLD